MNRKMKVAMSLLVLLTIVAASSPFIVSVESQNPDFTYAVEPRDTLGEVGETFTVNVTVYDAEYVYSWQVYMHWDNLTLQFISYVYAGWLTDQPAGSTVYTRLDPDFAILSEATSGQYMGKSADEALLVSVTFEILEKRRTTIQIDHATLTKYVYCITPPAMTAIYDFTKENGYCGPWEEDFDGDGVIDIWDISQVCILYGVDLTYTKNPTTYDLDPGDEWTTPEYALASDDSYAETASDGATETYGGYGFYAYEGRVTVEVGIECFQEDDGEWVKIRVSGNGGSSYGATYELTPLGTVDPDTPTWIDMTGSLKPINMTDANFMVQIEYDKAGSAKRVFVDWLPVRVTYDPYADLSGNGEVWIEDLAQVASVFGEIYA